MELARIALAIVVMLVVGLIPAPAMSQDSLGLGDNVSVEVTRANETSTETSGEENGDTPPPSGCLIATAAFGSELTPQVQFLRDFRDERVMSTVTGSSFMAVFNSWYYSFSPQVADYERDQPWLQATVKSAIYPLLGILYVAEKGYGVANGEGGSVLAGFVASSLIGMVYLAPAAVAIRKKASANRLLLPLAIILAASLGMISAGTIVESSTLLTISTSVFVLSSIGIGIVAITYLARIVEAWLKKGKNTTTL